MMTPPTPSRDGFCPSNSRNITGHSKLSKTRAGGILSWFTFWRTFEIFLETGGEICYLTSVFIFQSREFLRFPVKSFTFDTGHCNNELGPYFPPSFFSNRKGRIFKLTREFIAYEGDTHIVQISAEQNTM